MVRRLDYSSNTTCQKPDLVVDDCGHSRIAQSLCNAFNRWHLTMLTFYCSIQVPRIHAENCRLGCFPGFDASSDSAETHAMMSPISRSMFHAACLTVSLALVYERQESRLFLLRCITYSPGNLPNPWNTCSDALIRLHQSKASLLPALQQRCSHW